MEEVGEVIGLLDGATSQQSTNDLYIHSHSTTFSIPHKSSWSRTASTAWSRIAGSSGHSDL